MSRRRVFAVGRIEPTFTRDRGRELRLRRFPTVHPPQVGELWNGRTWELGRYGADIRSAVNVRLFELGVDR